MFKAIISRVGGCPWGATGMTSATWLGVPVETFAIADLTATQDGVYFHALAAGPAPVGGDPYPHVIEWAGGLYLEDGHHRVVRALLAGQATIEARRVTVAAAGVPSPLKRKGGPACQTPRSVTSVSSAPVALPGS